MPPRESALMIYPERGWQWLFYRLPFWLWRMGARPLMRFRMSILTTRGRKSGLPRHTMLEFAVLDDRAYLGAGWGDRSHWVKNLLADPRVVLESGLGIQRGRAVRVTDPDTMRRLYPEMSKSPVWMQYCSAWGVNGADPDDVAAKADQLWTFRIDPDDSNPDLTQQPLDLWWVSVSLTGLALFAWSL